MGNGAANDHHDNYSYEYAARADRIVSLLGLAVSLPRTWVKRARQRRELMGLLSQPEYYLKDVGLQRDEISREGLKPFWTA